MDKKKLIVYALVCSLLTGVAVYGVVTFMPQKRLVPFTKHLIDKNKLDKTDVFIYFGAAADTFLVAEKRVVDGAADPTALAKNVIDALIAGPTDKNLVRVLPEGTVCRAFYLTDEGLAYADFSAQIKEKYPGGCDAELLTIYAIVDSLMLNVDQIKKVKILIEGNEADTLAGHIDLRYPFSANMRMIK